jgi:hypothetical protein
MGALTLKLVADASSLTSGLASAQKSVDRFMEASSTAGAELGGGLNRALESFQSLAKGGAATAGVLAGAAIAAGIGLTAMAVSASNQAEEIEQLSAKLGLGAEKLQEYDVLLNRVGLGGDDLSRMFKTLSTNLEQAQQGTGTAGDRFRQLGIDITKVTSTDDLLRKVAQSISGFADGAGKAAIVADLLGKEGLKFIPAFEGGAAAIDKAAEASARIGATLSGDQLKTLNILNDAIDDFSLAWKRFAQQVSALVAPAITYIVDLLTDLLGIMSNFIKGTDAAAAAAESADKRRAPPKLVNSQEVSSRAQQLADARIKASEAAFSKEDQLAQANFNNLKAMLDQQKTLHISTDLEIAQANAKAADEMAAFQEESLNRQIGNYKKYIDAKMQLFTGDEKGQQEKAKFEIDSTQKLADLYKQLQIVQVNASTARIAAATQTGVAIREEELKPLQDAMTLAKADYDLSESFYRNSPALIGASSAARQKAFELIEAEGNLQEKIIDQTIKDEGRKTTALIALDGELQAKRNAAIAQFPDFFEQQMTAIVQSNAFSMGQMVSTWTGGIAQMIVKGGDLKAAMEQTQIAIIQGFLNAGVQKLANYALEVSRETAINEAKEAAKTAATAAGAAERTAITEAEATSEVGIMAGATEAILGFFASVSAGLEAIFVETLLPAVTAVGEFIMEVLSAIAEALADTIFGIPVAVAILAGVAAIGAALALSGAIKFAKGGIATGPTNALIGEAGSPEAVIPLNDQGAAFMRQALGMGGGQLVVPVMVDRREIGRAVYDNFPSALRDGGVPA